MARHKSSRLPKWCWTAPRVNPAPGDIDDRDLPIAKLTDTFDSGGQQLGPRLGASLVLGPANGPASCSGRRADHMRFQHACTRRSLITGDDPVHFGGYWRQRLQIFALGRVRTVARRTPNFLVGPHNLIRKVSNFSGSCSDVRARRRRAISGQNSRISASVVIEPTSQFDQNTRSRRRRRSSTAGRRPRRGCRAPAPA